MNKKLKIFMIILLLITIISTASYCSAPFDTETAHFISVRSTVCGSGYILKNETPIKISGGVFEPSISDGDRVSKGSVIGISITGDLDGEVAAELSEVTARINEIKNSESIADIYSSDQARIFSAMRTVTNDIRQSVLEGNLTAASESAAQLTTLMEKSKSVKGAAAQDELLVSLEEKKYQLEEQLGGMRKEVPSPAAGYFYSTLDGMEKTIRENDIIAITNSDISGFEKTLETYKPSLENAGKVTDTYAWYLAASIPTEDAQKLKTGTIVTVSVDESAFVSATVLAVNSDSTEKSAILLKSDKNISGVFEKRTAQFEICLAEHTGLYVPSAAIRVRDEIIGVYVIDENNHTTFKCVNILMEGEDYHIVQSGYVPPETSPYQSLKTYDNILVNPEVSDID